MNIVEQLAFWAVAAVGLRLTLGGILSLSLGHALTTRDRRCNEER
ncbi:hypothetical protein [Sphingomonas echinoides]|jgi:hypothetical protein|nr:hypothetical protein [Sphingomonas echinoides]